jgi:toxin FitB
MKYLVDANVLSEPTKSVPDARVVSWLSDHEADCVVDPIILGEMYVGVLVLPDGRKRSGSRPGLTPWFRRSTVCPGMLRLAAAGRDWCRT